MKPGLAQARARDDTRLLVIDPATRATRSARIGQLPEFLRAGDLVVVNDAATLPASLPAWTEAGAQLELRLLGPSNTSEDFRVILFGAGDYRTRTEERPPPPSLPIGTRVLFDAPPTAARPSRPTRVATSVLAADPGDDAARARDASTALTWLDTTDAERRGLSARVTAQSALSPRLVELRFDRAGAELWQALYALGRPVQYAHQREPLELWSVQTVYASRPWAAEMPSAGRPLSFATLLGLKRRGVSLASLTHATGLSSTGDPALDRALPLPERYDLPLDTVHALARARAAGGRVVAVGTTVVRALESAALRGAGIPLPGEAVSELHITPSFRLQVVDGILSGVHSPEESHYDLLGAFADSATLRDAHEQAEALGFLNHEFGDASLILGGALARQSAPSMRQSLQKQTESHARRLRPCQ